MKGKKVSSIERLRKAEADKNERVRLFKGLCSHVANGFSLDCYPEMSLACIEEWIKRFPEEFDENLLKEALRKGKVYWEGLGRAQANGTCLGNSRTWFYNMAHRYKWSDRVQVEQEHKGQVSVNVVSYASKKVLQGTQSEQGT